MTPVLRRRNTTLSSSRNCHDPLVESVALPFCGRPIQANRKRTDKSRTHLSADAALIVFTLTPAL